jgi:regulator of cell morphogenesis and NO signaling
MSNENKPGIALEWTVNTTIRRFPQTIPVFNEFGVDSCCGGEASLEQAAAEAGVEAARLIDALVDVVATEGAAR